MCKIDEARMQRVCKVLDGATYHEWKTLAFNSLMEVVRLMGYVDHGNNDAEVLKGTKELLFFFADFNDVINSYFLKKEDVA